MFAKANTIHSPTSPAERPQPWRRIGRITLARMGVSFPA